MDGLVKTSMEKSTKMNNKLATRGANDGFEMSQSDVAEKLFLKQQTIAKIEKSAIENLKRVFQEKKINVKDYLND
jgi:DNA-binding XRE family transcriptional regulator